MADVNEAFVSPTRKPDIKLNHNGTCLTTQGVYTCDRQKGVPNPRTESIVSMETHSWNDIKLNRPRLFGYRYEDRDKTSMAECILMKFRIFEGDYSEKFLESIRPD